MRSQGLPPPLWIGGIVLALCGWWVFFETPVQADLSTFLPRSSSPLERLLFEELRESPAARLVLIAIEGGSEVERASASAVLANKLRGSQLFVRVANGADDFGENEREKLFAYRYLLSPDPNPQQLGPAGLRSALEQRLRELQSPASTFSKHVLAEDPTASFLGYAAGLQGTRHPDTRHGLWFSEHGTRALLLAETRARGFDLDAQAEALRQIRNEFSAVGNSKGLRLLLSGPAVFAVDSRDIIKSQSNLLGGAALLGVMVILLVGYRSLPLLLIGALPIAAALLVGISVVSLLYGGIHGISLAFGITLIGVTLDYPIHLFSHIRMGEPAALGAIRIWPTLRLGAVTTCIGFLAMATTHFSGLSQVALLAVSGILAAALVARWVLPSVLARSGFSGLSAFDRPNWGMLCAPSRAIRVAGLLAGASGLLYLGAIGAPEWEADLAALSPIPEHLIARDRDLREQLKAPDVNHLLAIAAGDAETLLQRAESLEPQLRDLVAQGLIEGYEIPTRLLPSRKTQLSRRAMLPDAETLRANLSQALSGLPFKQGFFEPFEDAVSQARGLQPLDPADLEGTAIGLRISSQVFRGDDDWLLIIPLSGVANPEEVARKVEANAPAGISYLDIKGETTRILTAFRNGAMERLGLGAVLIGVLLAFSIRSVAGVLRIALPVALALTLDLAILSATGERLSLFHLVSLLLVMGIGLDYSLFFARRDDTPDTRARTLHAVTLCALSTLCVFGLLSLSSIPVLNAIGKTIGIGVLCSYFMALALSRSATPAQP